VIRAISRLAAAAAASMVLLAVATGTAPANTPSASYQFVNQAQLQENGTVNVTVYYLCQPSRGGSIGFIDVLLEQPGVSGASGQEAKCDDQKHKVTFAVGPFSGAFSRGSAAARGEVLNNTASSIAEKQAEITIR
jgi:hypothetical protein